MLGNEQLLLDVCDRALAHLERVSEGGEHFAEDDVMRVFLANAGEVHDADIILGYVLADLGRPTECTLSVECDGALPGHAFNFGVELKAGEFTPACRTEDAARNPSVLPMIVMPYWTGIRLTCPPGVDAGSLRVYCIKVVDAEVRKQMIGATHSLQLLPDISELIERRIEEPAARRRAKERHDLIAEELMVYFWAPGRLAALSADDPVAFWDRLDA
jgi:hypothetical protein